MFYPDMPVNAKMTSSLHQYSAPQIIPVPSVVKRSDDGEQPVKGVQEASNHVSPNKGKRQYVLAPLSEEKKEPSAMHSPDNDVKVIDAKSVWKFSRPLPPISPSAPTAPSSSSYTTVKATQDRPREGIQSHSNDSKVSTALAGTNQSHQLSAFTLYLMTDRVARPWQFTYFYKSGAFKDQFQVYLRFFSVHAIRGKGIDSIGYFTVDGRVETDIVGPKILLNKTYYHGGDTPFHLDSATSNTSAVDFLSDIDDPALAHTAANTTMLDQIMHLSNSGVGGGNGKGAATTRDAHAHVRHLAYWSEGITLQNSTDQHPPQSFGTAELSPNTHYWANTAARW
jgi:hypothetical protein